MAYSFFTAPDISASHRPLDASLLSRTGIRSLFFYMQYFIKNIGSVMKSMCHPFRTDMSHMCHACEICRFEIIPFLDSLGVGDRAWYL
jgi:hypothetical protein